MQRVPFENPPATDKSLANLASEHPLQAESSCFDHHVAPLDLATSIYTEISRQNAQLQEEVHHLKEQSLILATNVKKVKTHLCLLRGQRNLRHKIGLMGSLAANVFDIIRKHIFQDVSDPDEFSNIAQHTSSFKSFASALVTSAQKKRHQEVATLWRPEWDTILFILRQAGVSSQSACPWLLDPDAPMTAPPITPGQIKLVAQDIFTTPDWLALQAMTDTSFDHVPTSEELVRNVFDLVDFVWPFATVLARPLFKPVFQF